MKIKGKKKVRQTSYGILEYKVDLRDDDNDERKSVIERERDRETEREQERTDNNDLISFRSRR
jgi:hypothetical protein